MLSNPGKAAVCVSPLSRSVHKCAFVRAGICACVRACVRGHGIHALVSESSSVGSRGVHSVCKPLLFERVET